MNSIEVFAVNTDNHNNHSIEQTLYDRTLDWRGRAKRVNAVQNQSSDRVEVVHQFIANIERSHIFFYKNLNDLLNGIYSLKRKFLIYTQLAFLWIIAIKFQLNSLVRDDYLDTLTANIALLIIERHEIFTQFIAFLLVYQSVLGKFIIINNYRIFANINRGICEQIIDMSYCCLLSRYK